jgi:hypothetical protein
MEMPRPLLRRRRPGGRRVLALVIATLATGGVIALTPAAGHAGEYCPVMDLLPKDCTEDPESNLVEEWMEAWGSSANSFPDARGQAENSIALSAMQRGGYCFWGTGSEERYGGDGLYSWPPPPESGMQSCPPSTAVVKRRVICRVRR